MIILVPPIAFHARQLKEKIDDLMLETPEFPEIKHPGYFVGGEHPIHKCFEEFSSDVSGDLPPDILPAKFLDPLRVILRDKYAGIPQILSRRWDRS